MTADDEALEAFRALRGREPTFHRAEFGRARADFEAMMAEGFWEVGASGTVDDRATILDVLEARFADPAYDPLAGMEVGDFAVRELGPGVWLATYRLVEGERVTRRASVWRKASGSWVLMYHQGTIVAGETAGGARPTPGPEAPAPAPGPPPTPR